MPSRESQALTDLYLKLNTYFRSETLDTELYCIIFEELASVSAEPTEVTYEEIQCPGTVRPALWIKPQSAASSSSVILFLHGGAFIAGSSSCWRKMVGHLAKKAGCQALSIDYRRAPEFQFPCQIEDALAAYKWLLLENGYSSKNIAFADESAGGKLVVSTSLAAKQAGLAVPAAIAAFSPWLDMTVSGKSYQTNAHKDVVCMTEALQGVVNSYVGKASLDDPLIDLIYTDLTGLPPMYLTAGTSEVLQDDTVQLAENARRAGVEVQLKLAKDMQHVWICMAGNAREADETISQAADFIRKRIGK